MAEDDESGVSVSEVRRGGPDPFEIALWVFGLALIALAMWVFSFAADPTSLNEGISCSGQNCTAPDGYALRQFGYMMGPGVLTGGIVCVGLALALRALRRILRPRQGERSVPGVEARSPRPVASAEAVWSADRNDHRIFMRPGD